MNRPALSIPFLSLNERGSEQQRREDAKTRCRIREAFGDGAFTAAWGQRLKAEG